MFWIKTEGQRPDGFVALHGRADGAINRGVFKILPETVRRVLISHPAVRDACASACPTPRLGQVPFAAIEATPGLPMPTDDELKGLVRQSLPFYNVPVACAVVDELRRSPAMKVSLPGRRRALRTSRKQVVARRVLPVVVHRRLIA
jgi:long-chain acyl-CoA synthetase